MTHISCPSALILSLIIIVVSCKETEPLVTVPAVDTQKPTEITSFSARVGGILISDGGGDVIQSGVCYGKNEKPTLADLIAPDADGGGIINCILTGLEEQATYYCRAFATNRAGTGYGNQVGFTTLKYIALPVVNTTPVKNITITSAWCGGEVISDGSDTTLTRGLCWSMNTLPTVLDSHTVSSSGTGVFSDSLPDLIAGSPYFVRAYATNSAGTSYGNQVSFTIFSGSPCLDMPVLTDPRDGHTYPTVQIGDQCWMQKNLNYDTAGSWCYQYIQSNCDSFGRYYSWPAVLAVCPPGWHLPNETEADSLALFLGGAKKAGGRMKETGYSHWFSPNQGATNLSGFTALGTGRRINNIPSFEGLMIDAVFWATKKNHPDEPCAFGVRYNANQLSISSYGYFIDSFSVRCLKD